MFRKQKQRRQTRHSKHRNGQLHTTPASDSSWQSHHLITPILIVIFAGMTFFALKNYLHRQPLNLLPIKHVTISGKLHYTNYETLKQKIMQLPPMYFFSVDINNIDKKLSQNQPWIRSIKAYREWPSTLAITIDEYNPVAIWNNLQILDKDGKVFITPAQTNPLLKELPQLSGPSNRETEIWNNYISFNKILSPLKMNIKTISLSMDKQWQLKLNNGLIVYLGSKNIILKLNNFTTLYPLLVNQYKKTAASFDLRYPHAIAVQAKT